MVFKSVRIQLRDGGGGGGGGGGGTKDNWKPYQHDIEALELALRFLDRENEMVRREYWGRREY